MASGAMSRAVLGLALAVQAAAQTTGSSIGGMVDMACSMVKVPVVCGASAPTPASTGCQGDGCCMGSSCMGIPMLGCKDDRGATECVGSSTFPFPKKGMCQCTSGICGGTGRCVGGNNGGRPDYNRLFEDKEPVTPEDFTVAFMMLGLGFFGLFASFVALGLRSRHSGDRSGRLLLLVDDDDYANPEDRALE